MKTESVTPLLYGVCSGCRSAAWFARGWGSDDDSRSRRLGLKLSVVRRYCLMCSVPYTIIGGIERGEGPLDFPSLFRLSMEWHRECRECGWEGTYLRGGWWEGEATCPCCDLGTLDVTYGPARLKLGAEDIPGLSDVLEAMALFREPVPPKHFEHMVSLLRQIQAARLQVPGGPALVDLLRFAMRIEDMGDVYGLPAEAIPGLPDVLEALGAVPRFVAWLREHRPHTEDDGDEGEGPAAELSPTATDDLETLRRKVDCLTKELEHREAEQAEQDRVLKRLEKAHAVSKGQVELKKSKIATLTKTLDRLEDLHKKKKRENKILRDEVKRLSEVAEAALAIFEGDVFMAQDEWFVKDPEGKLAAAFAKACGGLKLSDRVGLHLRRSRSEEHSSNDDA